MTTIQHHGGQVLPSENESKGSPVYLQVKRSARADGAAAIASAAQVASATSKTRVRAEGPSNETKLVKAGGHGSLASIYSGTISTRSFRNSAVYRLMRKSRTYRLKHIFSKQRWQRTRRRASQGINARSVFLCWRRLKPTLLKGNGKKNATARATSIGDVWRVFSQAQALRFSG